MKNIKIIVILTHLLIGTLTFAQAPEKMSYQAVVRNTTNNLVTNQAVGMQISILQGSATGTAVYVETQTPTSNANGLVSLEIGSGAVVSGNMATINWANGPYFIKTETDPTGGTNYTITGTSQLLSTPYALYAKNGTPTGGTTGQVLAKVNGTDYNTQWVTPTSGGWNLTGNAGTSGSFIGTTDNVGLSFRTNNIPQWELTPKGRFTSLAPQNIIFGGGNETNTASGNTVIGMGSMINLTTGNFNTAIGSDVLQANTTGLNNTGLGNLALNSTTTGSANTGLGKSSLQLNTTGDGNTAIGQNALQLNATGSFNTAIGFGSGASANNLSNATAVGNGAIVNASNKIRLGNNAVTATDIAGQVKVNAQATGTNDFTLPATRGTANQVLSTDGAGATQWVTSSSGSSSTVLVHAISTTSQTFPIGGNNVVPDVATCFNNVVTNVGSAYNSGTGLFVAPTGGFYLFTVQAVSTTNVLSLVPMIDIDNNFTASGGFENDIFGTLATSAQFRTGTQNRGQLTAQVFLTAGQTISIRFQSVTNATTLSNTTTGSTYLVITKM